MQVGVQLVCKGCDICEPRQEMAKQQRKEAAKQRLLVIQASQAIELVGTSRSSIQAYDTYTLQASEAHTVREVLEIVAHKMELPEGAASWLHIEFEEVIVPHNKTLKEVGLCDKVQVSVLGEDDARVKVAEAERLDILGAARIGNIDDVQMVCTLAPHRVNFVEPMVATPVVPRSC